MEQIKKLKRSGLFTNYIYKAIPLVFDESMSYYEVLCGLLDYLKNSVIPTVNNNADAILELQEFVEHYFDSLDLQEEINNKLDNMAESGELDDIISMLFIKNSGTIVGNTFYRDCTEWLNGVTSESETNPLKGYIQGMVTTENTIIMAIQAGGAYENLLNKCYLVEISKANKNTIRESFLEINHANSIAYNEEASELYISSTSKVVNNEIVDDNSIIIIDYDTFTIKQTVSIDSSITSDNIGSVSYDNKNNVLAIATENDVYILNNWNSVKSTIHLNYSETAPIENQITQNHTVQNTILFDNRIYQTRYFKNGIVVYNINGEVIKNYYNFDFEVKPGEFESLAIEENGDVYISHVQRSWSTVSTIRFYDRVITKTNLIHNGYKNYYYYEYSERVETSGITLYVNPLTNNKIQMGTQTYPFKHIEQAIFMSNDINVPLYISCMENADYGFIITRNNKNISILGNNKATIKALIAQSQHMNIDKVTFDLSNDLELINERKNIYLEYSNIDFNNCSFTSNHKIDNGINSFHSNVFINTCTFNNFTNVFNNLNGTDLSIIFTNTFTNCDYKFNNNGFVSIHQDNMGIYNECNPNGELPIVVDKPQFIDVNKNGNVLTFKNPKCDSVIKEYMMTYDVNINGWGYHFTNKARLINTKFSEVLKSNNSNAIYFVMFTLTHSTNGITVTPVVYQLDLTSGSYSELNENNYSITYNSILAI